MTHTLSYETAKKLRDAGWPQPDFTVGDSDGKIWLREPRPEGWYDTDPELVYAPSLSELIAACPLMLRTKEWGDHYFTLEYWGSISNPWQAKMTRSDWAAVGSTPEEAVANLWLALQERKP